MITRAERFDSSSGKTYTEYSGWEMHDDYVEIAVKNYNDTFSVRRIKKDALKDGDATYLHDDPYPSYESDRVNGFPNPFRYEKSTDSFEHVNMLEWALLRSCGRFLGISFNGIYTQLTDDKHSDQKFDISTSEKLRKYILENTIFLRLLEIEVIEREPDTPFGYTAIIHVKQAGESLYKVLLELAQFFTTFEKTLNYKKDIVTVKFDGCPCNCEKENAESESSE